MLAWHRLAAYFKDPHLQLTWEQFMHWQAYFEIEPPEHNDNYRTALILERITNMSGKSVKKSVKVEDFMPKKETKQAQTMEEQKAFFRNLRGDD